MTPRPLLRLPSLALGLIALLTWAAPVPAAAQTRLTGHDKDELARLVQDWLSAPHADHGSLSFTYWNKQGEVPVECAACHSQPGFLDHLGADGTAPGVVDHPAAIGAPIGCAACHTEAAHRLDSVTFPSGAVVTGLGADAVCSTCHQGRQAGANVSTATAGLDEDSVAPGLGFLNIHYGIAAAVTGGADLGGGYHYPGQSYAGRFAHVPSANGCTACHDPHSTRVETEGCLSCHRGVTDLRDIRTRHGDFDGDGLISGGIATEIAGLRQHLHDAIQTYAGQISGAPIGYAPGQFPYFFHDSNADGSIGPDEAVFPNRYQSWTPRLLKAAYNYQLATKDKGAYVHNPRYVLQLLHDSLADLTRATADTPSRLPRP
jgi:hypothetical protein